MSHSISLFCETVLAILIVFHIIRSLLSEDKALIWSPITTISLTYAYYCLMPFFGGVAERFVLDEDLYSGHLFHIAALLSYVCILIGFCFSSKKQIFKNWNRVLNAENAGPFGLFLSVIGILSYASVRGFHLSIAADTTTRDLVIGGFVYYLMMMLDILPFAAVLLLIDLKENKKRIVLNVIVFWLIIVHILIAGARWRIVVLAVALLTSFYLFPKVKKANVIFIATLAIALYLGFSIMDKSRTRGSGINMEVAQSLSYSDIKGGASENSSVYSFSLKCMGRLHDYGERVYFQPIVTALLMPIPRSVFPWKPDADYLHSLETIVLGSDEGGAAYLNFVESYYSFGWFGVILWALILGWLSRRFWDNYRHNMNSLAGIVSLGVYSGFCYVAISRGFLAATLTTFLLSICLPFWFLQLVRRFSGL